MLDTPPVPNPVAPHEAARLDARALCWRIAIGVAAALAGALLKYAAFDASGALYIVFLPFSVTATVAGGAIAGVLAVVATGLLAGIFFLPEHGDAAADPFGFFASTIAFAVGTLALPLLATRLHGALHGALHESPPQTSVAVAASGFADDGTDRNEAGRQNDALTHERMSMIGEVAKSLAHRINQPLTAGVAYLKVAQRLSDRLPDASGADIGDAIGKAIGQLMRAGEIVRDLREFVAHGEPDKTLVSLHALIEDALLLVRAQARDADVNVEVGLESGEDQIVADRGQLRQVLANLLRNAIEAMRGSQRRELRITTAMRNGAIRVEISDTGRGLGGLDATQLFQPRTSAEATGMGIGLSTSRAIVEAHYGAIWSKPNPGGGAVFGFDLPLSDRDSNS